MTGHVFHPGHHPLHGITVVLETRGPRTYVGRFDMEDDAGLHLLDVGVHEPSAGQLSKTEYLQRTAKFGVRVEQKHVCVPAAEVATISPLGALS